MQYWPFLLLLAIPAFRYVWQPLRHTGRVGGLSFTGITVLLLIIVGIVIALQPAHPPATDYEQGDSAVRALIGN